MRQVQRKLRRRVGWPGRATAWLLVAAAWGAGVYAGSIRAAQAELKPEPPADAQPVDFDRDIWPIFVAHCHKCHGAEMRSGGLRLDLRSEAALGGDSGKPVLGGTLATNELYARVSSTERTHRMPKNSEALPADDIDKLRRWVEQGTRWSGQSASKTAGWYLRTVEWFGKAADRFAYELERAWPVAGCFIGIQLVLLAIARGKAAYGAGRRWATGRAAPICKLCSEVRNRELTMAWLFSVSLTALAMVLIHQRKLNEELAELEKAKAVASSRWAHSVYGRPPVPIRPGHGKQIAGTYYRGNCERNEQLFNDGNYLTAIFRVSLCDGAHRPLELGDPLPPDGVHLRLEIERAPGTTDHLYSKSLMDSVFLTKKFYGDDMTSLAEEPARLEVLDEDRRWVSYLPLGEPSAAGTINGLAYVYTGQIRDGEVRGEPHYGIKYDLHFRDGKLTDDSDVWMNSFGNPSVANPEPPDKIPYREWFDYRPIPTIEGENSSDPKLLGVDEYVKRGLIPPPPDAPPSDPPENDSSAQESPRNATPRPDEIPRAKTP